MKTERAATLATVPRRQSDTTRAHALNWAVGVATARIVEAILRDENAVLTVSRWLDDYHGISDVCLSVPCLVNRRGVEPPLPVPMSAEEVAGLQASAEVVREAAHAAGL